jgi:hypothetical protein
VRGLDGDEKALVVMPLLTALGVLVKGKFFEIIVCDVCVLAVARIASDLLLLALQEVDQRVELALSLLKLLSLLLNLAVFIPQGWGNEIDWIGQLFEGPSHTLFSAASKVIASKVGSWTLPAVDGTWAVPADIVLSLLCNESNSFEYIRDIVYTPLLDVEELDGVVEVKGLVGGFFQQVDEFFGQLNQPVFFAATPVAAFTA